MKKFKIYKYPHILLVRYKINRKNLNLLKKNQEIKECKVLTKMIFSQYQPQFIVNKFKMLLQMRLT